MVRTTALATTVDDTVLSQDGANTITRLKSTHPHSNNIQIVCDLLQQMLTHRYFILEIHVPTQTTATHLHRCTVIYCCYAHVVMSQS